MRQPRPEWRPYELPPNVILQHLLRYRRNIRFQEGELPCVTGNRKASVRPDQQHQARLRSLRMRDLQMADRDVDRVSGEEPDNNPCRSSRPGSNIRSKQITIYKYSEESRLCSRLSSYIKRWLRPPSYYLPSLWLMRLRIASEIGSLLSSSERSSHWEARL